jgi:hypothetical protein
MVDDILLVLEVEVEGALGYSGAVYDVGDGSIGYALGSEQIIRLGQYSITLKSFVVFSFSHINPLVNGLFGEFTQNLTDGQEIISKILTVSQKVLS